jgi:hypothetical protein
MLTAGFDPGLLIRAVRKVEAASWVRLASIRDFVSAGSAEICKWCDDFDRAQRRSQKQDRMGRAVEACMK